MLEKANAAHLFVGPCSFAQCLGFRSNGLAVAALQRAQRIVYAPAWCRIAALRLWPWAATVLSTRGSVERRRLGRFAAVRRGEPSRGRWQRVALLFALLAKQERHGAGSTALGTLQWQRVPVTHAFGLYARRAARGLGRFGVRAGEMCSSGIEVGEAGRRAMPRCATGKSALWVLAGRCAHVSRA